MKFALRGTKVLVYGLWTLGYCLAFVVFAYMAFPYARLKEYVVARVNSGASEGAHLQIEGLSWSFRFPGVVAEGVEWTPAPAADAKGPTPGLRIEKVYAGVAPLAFLLGSKSVELSFDGLGGHASGKLSEKGALRTVRFELEGLELAQVPQIVESLGVPVLGTLSGTGEVRLQEKSWAKADGKFELHGEGIMVGSPKAKIKGLLPAMDLGELTVRGEIEAGRLKLEELKADGKDIKLSADGSVRLRDRLEMSVLELDLKLNFTTAYRGRDESTKALFGEPGSNIPGLFESATSRMLAKREDGSFEARVTGPMLRPALRPAGAAGAPANAEDRAARRRNVGRAGAKPEAPTRAAPQQEAAPD
jgi:type II secretion system protein N